MLVVGGPDFVGSKIPIVTENGDAEFTVDPPLVTATAPVPASGGTAVTMVLAEFTTHLAATAPKLTEQGAVNPEPVIVTCLPTGPEDGENENDVP